MITEDKLGSDEVGEKDVTQAATHALDLFHEPPSPELSIEPNPLISTDNIIYIFYLVRSVFGQLFLDENMTILNENRRFFHMGEKPHANF